MLRTLLVVALGVMLVGCKSESTTPVSVVSTSNPNVPIALLFEHDGCKVYRFVADNRYRYFSKCETASSSSVSSEWTEHCGKGCVRTIEDENQTSYSQ